MVCPIAVLGCHGARTVLSFRQLPLILRRTFLVFGSSPEDRTMSYKEKRLLGYSQEQMFDIAADVSRYKEFVPWCNDSAVIRQIPPDSFEVRLGVGFPPLSETYHSTVTLRKPGHVRSIAQDCYLFNHLVNEWNFRPGLTDNPRTCTVEFAVDFEFKSLLHSKVAGLFFDQVVAMMVNAFLERARILHGPAALPIQKPQILAFKR